jgi:hypothetical protein
MIKMQIFDYQQFINFRSVPFRSVFWKMEQGIWGGVRWEFTDFWDGVRNFDQWGWEQRLIV